MGAALAAGLCGGALAAWLLTAAGSGDAVTRADLDEVAARVDVAAVATAGADGALADRVGEIERRLLDTDSGRDTYARAELRALREAVQGLQDDVRRELEVVAARLDWLETRLSGAAGPGANDDGTLSEDEEKELAIQARDPDDAGVRFSALVLLGNTRTSRSVQASRDRLDDRRDFVVWQALRNLGRFRETATAADVARKLDHDSAVVRAAAAAALVAMGAPETGYDPSAPATARATGAKNLKDWAEQQ